MSSEFENDFLKDNRIRMDWKVVRWSLKTAWEMDKKTFSVWAVVTLLSSFIPALFLTMLQQIVDGIQANVEAGLGVQSIVLLLVSLVVVMLVRNVFYSIPNLMWTSLDTKYGVGMVRRLSEFLRKVPVHYFDDARTAKLMSVAQKENKELGRFVDGFFCCIGSLITFASMGLVAWRTSPWLLAVTAVYLAGSLPMSIYISKLNYKTWADMADNHRRAEYFYSRVFKEETAKEVRLLDMKDFFTDKWRADQKVVNDMSILRGRRNTVCWNAQSMIVVVVKFLMLFVGVVLLGKGRMTVGGLTVFVSVFTQISNAAANFGENLMELYENSCKLKFKMLLFTWDLSKKRPVDPNCKGPSKRKPGEKPVVFECQHVSFGYKEGQEVLHDLNLRIHKGETVALVGENGAGKSTLIKLLLGLYEPKSGELYFEGKNYRDIDTSKLVEHIGVTFQDFVRFELMIRENVSFGDISKVADDQTVRQAIENGGASHIVKRMPKDIDTYLGRWYEKEGVRMSGGEWQRIAVSRSYINNKDILIMDEPAAALDPIAEMEQFDRIKHSLKERTSILISHRIGFARLADQILVLQEGRLAECGSHDELMAKKGIYYEMFSNQAGWYDDAKEGA